MFCQLAQAYFKISRMILLGGLFVTFIVNNNSLCNIIFKHKKYYRLNEYQQKSIRLVFCSWEFKNLSATNTTIKKYFSLFYLFYVIRKPWIGILLIIVKDIKN